MAHLKRIVIVMICYCSFTLLLTGNGQVVLVAAQVPECGNLVTARFVVIDRWEGECDDGQCEGDCQDEVGVGSVRDRCYDMRTCCCNPRCGSKLYYQGNCTHAACDFDCATNQEGGSRPGTCDNVNECCCDPREDNVPGTEAQADP